MPSNRRTKRDALSQGALANRDDLPPATRMAVNDCPNETTPVSPERVRQASIPDDPRLGTRPDMNRAPNQRRRHAANAGEPNRGHNISLFKILFTLFTGALLFVIVHGCWPSADEDKSLQTYQQALGNAMQVVLTNSTLEAMSAVYILTFPLYYFAPHPVQDKHRNAKPPIQLSQPILPGQILGKLGHETAHTMQLSQHCLLDLGGVSAPGAVGEMYRQVQMVQKAYDEIFLKTTGFVYALEIPKLNAQHLRLAIILINTNELFDPTWTADNESSEERLKKIEFNLDLLAQGIERNLVIWRSGLLALAEPVQMAVEGLETIKHIVMAQVSPCLQQIIKAEHLERRANAEIRLRQIKELVPHLTRMQGLLYYTRSMFSSVNQAMTRTVHDFTFSRKECWAASSSFSPAMRIAHRRECLRNLLGNDHISAVQNLDMLHDIVSLGIVWKTMHTGEFDWMQNQVPLAPKREDQAADRRSGQERDAFKAQNQTISERMRRRVSEHIREVRI